MKAVIFGVSGQDGHYLSLLLNDIGVSVIGISRDKELVQISISDFEAVHRLIKTEQPDYIFHLAANSTTRHEALFENHSTIATGTLNILESVRLSSPQTKVFISGSGLQFTNKGLPIKETDAFEARDAYSISRIESVFAARYFLSLGIKTYVGYFFNHESPLRTERHMTKKIAEAAKRIASGSLEKLEIGDVSAIKEYAFAGDIVKGIWTLVNQDSITEANISTGKGYSIEEWLNQCFSYINKDWKDYVIANPSFKAPYKQLVSDPSRINSIGWRPQTGFEELTKIMMG